MQMKSNLTFDGAEVEVYNIMDPTVTENPDMIAEILELASQSGNLNEVSIPLEMNKTYETFDADLLAGFNDFIKGYKKAEKEIEGKYRELQAIVDEVVERNREKSEAAE